MDGASQQLFLMGLMGRIARAVLRRLAIRLGAPNYPHDTMTMSGRVSGVSGATVDVGLRGYNRLGNHVTGTVTLELPAS